MSNVVFFYVVAIGAVIFFFSLWYGTQSSFSNLLLLYAGVFIGTAFVADMKSRLLAVAVGLLGAIPVAYVLLQGMRGFRQREKVWLTSGRGPLRWVREELTGRKARQYWLLQVVCSASLLIYWIGGMGYLAITLKPDPPRVAGPQRMIVRNDKQIYETLNKTDAAFWEKWPSLAIREQAGANAWGEWRPQIGDEGELVGSMQRPEGRKIYVVKFGKKRPDILRTIRRAWGSRIY